MRLNIPRIGIILIMHLSLAVSVAAQTPSFQPLMTGHRVSAAVSVGESVFAGMPKGGLIDWNRSTGEAERILTRRDGLSGHFVTALAWTGERLWVATADGGLTAITDPGGEEESLLQVTSLLSSLDVTAVSGSTVGTTERVYYGTDGAGIGEIVGGLPGAYYTTQNGLIDDTIDDIAVTEGIVLIATPSGISRFGSNTFSNYPYGDPETDAPNDIEVGPDGSVWAAMADGIHRWDDAARDWEHVFGAGEYLDLAVDGDTVWALAWNGVLELVGGSGTTLPLPPPPAGQQFIATAVAGVDGEAFVCGYLRPEGYVQLGSLVSAPVVASLATPPAELAGIASLQIGVAGGVDGVAIDSRNRPWVGDREGDGVGSFDGSRWYNATERGTVANDFAGLLNFGGGVLAMARDGDALWFNQYVAGVLRFVPAEAPGGDEEWLQLTPFNSPLQGDSHEAIAVHPDGVVLFGTSSAYLGSINNAVLGVDVLIDQDLPREEDSWLHLYPATLGGGNFIGAIAVERRDVIWFAVRETGLLRWDVNGDAAGPDDPLTWLDTRDDVWSQPILNVPGSELELDKGNAIVVAADGSIFVGGQGLVRFRYEPFQQQVTPLGEWVQKETAIDDGLLGQSVTGLGIDRNDDLWALTSGGLNRLRFHEDDTVDVDAFTDLATYLTFDSSFYSPNVISPLPGGEYRGLDLAADGRSLVVSSDLGAAAAQIPERLPEVVEGDLDTAYLYPNPFTGEGQASHIGIGGLDIDGDKPVSVEILNMVGQIVYRSSELPSGELVWDGRNRQGRRVASGLYLVKLMYGGRTAVRTLAVTY